MLSFSGNVFDRSPFLKEKYGSFISPTCNSPFMQIDCVDDWEQQVTPPPGDIEKEIGTVRFTGAADASRMVVDCFRYKCLAEKEFSRVTMRASYVRNLSQDAYNRLNECLHQVARLRALYLNMLVLHASVVVHDDEAILFSGVSGAGKSTQANLWVQHENAWVLNYDKPLVRFDEKRAVVSGSPWGGKEDLAINEVRPVRALFFVHKAKENRVVRLSPGQAYSQIFLNYMIYPLNKDIEARYSDAVMQLLSRVPVYDLHCTATQEAVDCVKRALQEK